MKILILWMLVTFISDPIEIARINRIKKEAAAAYNDGNYEIAANKYKLLVDSMSVDEDEILLNLGHSYYQMKDTLHAKNRYTQVSSSPNQELRSVALQQLGVMAKEKMALDESLQYLKASLKANPMNEQSRYNYEVVKKLLENQKNQNKDQNQQDEDNQDQNKDQNKENQDQQKNEDQQKQDQEKSEEQKDQEQKDQEGKEGEQQEEQQQEGEQQDKEDQQDQQAGTKEKLEEMNISEEKAKMILEAMKNNEFQYIQQRKRKPTKQQDSGKPDW